MASPIPHTEIQPDMLDRLVAFFIGHSKGYITKEQLTNLLYLVDLNQVKHGNKQLTDLAWMRKTVGVVCPQLDARLEQLQGSLFTYKMLDVQSGKPNIKCMSPVKPIPVQGLGFSMSLLLQLDNLHHLYAGQHKARTLADQVRQSQPVQVALEKGEEKINLKHERKKFLRDIEDL